MIINYNLVLATNSFLVVGRLRRPVKNKYNDRMYSESSDNEYICLFLLLDRQFNSPFIIEGWPASSPYYSLQNLYIVYSNQNVSVSASYT